MRRYLVIAATIALLVGQAARADVTLPALIGDHMVLQRAAKVNVWGQADPGEKVTVTFVGQKVSAVADGQGRWKVQLAPMPAGGPFEMTVAGKNTLTLKNILVGEVWVCAGQSNMAMGVGTRAASQKEIAANKYAKIRLFSAGVQDALTPQDSATGRWRQCNERKTVYLFSAIGFLYGWEIHKSQNVPVGLISCVVGGTGISAWMSEKSLSSDPAFKGVLGRRAAEHARSERLRAEYKAKLDAWQQAVAKAKDEGTDPPRKPYRPRYIGKYTTGFYNGMVHPLSRYGVRGVLWYQGSGNAYSYGTASQYERLFPAMIKDWRSAWGGEVYFLFVQLPNYHARLDDPSGGGDTQVGWARLREAQLKTLTLPRTGMAVTIDIGEARSIHPTNKTDVALRLSRVARAVVYGEDIVHYGPMFDSMSVQGAKARLKFTHVGGGLVAKGGRKLTGFAVAGADKTWHWAEAVIDGGTIVVSSEKVAQPAAVRYAWADNPACNLYNKEGIPASPFRTDDWTPPRKRR